MILCVRSKFDKQNRILIPREYIRGADGSPDGECYITFNEITKQILIIPVKEEKKKSEETNESTC